MGAMLVGAALNPHWAQLSETDRLILITMAHTALDNSRTGDRPARVYWAGHEYLMAVLLGHEPDPGTPEWEAARKRVQRSIGRLIAAGTIERVDAANGRKRTRYRIRLDEFNQPELPTETE